MARAFGSVAAFLDHGADDLIDVRSPSEYAEDHVPGAISLPVLTDEERARVGTIYVQDSPFRARKIGAALVARNAAQHIEGPLADREGGWRPLVYCWRGGQRSGSFATILGQIGWRAETVEGGYRTWRRLVQAMLYREPLAHRIVLLDGLTGTGKTEVLRRLGAMGFPVLDLEGLARHRGSLLGAMPVGQPAQTAFETGIAAALARMDPARPVLVEAESSKVGDRSVPPSLWAAMKAAPRIVVTATPEVRGAYLADAYADLAADPDRLEALLRRLTELRGRAVVEGWVGHLRAGRTRELAAALMEQHYDPAYRRHAKRGGAPLAEVAMDGIDATAARVAALVWGQEGGLAPAVGIEPTTN